MEPATGQQADAAEGAEFVLHLYITGATPNSARAVRNLTDICQRYLVGRCDMQVIDIYQQPERAIEAAIVAAPTLIKHRPGLRRFLVGDLSDRRRVLALLGIAPDPADPNLHP